MSGDVSGPERDALAGEVWQESDGVLLLCTKPGEWWRDFRGDGVPWNAPTIARPLRRLLDATGNLVARPPTEPTAEPCGECEDGCLHGTVTPCPRCRGRLVVPTAERAGRLAADTGEHTVRDPQIAVEGLRERVEAALEPVLRAAAGRGHGRTSDEVRAALRDLLATPDAPGQGEAAAKAEAGDGS